MTTQNQDNRRIEEVPPTAGLIDAKSVARLLGVSSRTVWRLHSSGKLPQAIKLGGSVRWREQEISAWIAAGCPERKAWKALVSQNAPKTWTRFAYPPGG